MVLGDVHGESALEVWKQVAKQDIAEVPRSDSAPEGTSGNHYIFLSSGRSQSVPNISSNMSFMKPEAPSSRPSCLQMKSDLSPNPLISVVHHRSGTVAVGHGALWIRTGFPERDRPSPANQPSFDHACADTHAPDVFFEHRNAMRSSMLQAFNADADQALGRASLHMRQGAHERSGPVPDMQRSLPVCESRVTGGRHLIREFGAALRGDDDDDKDDDDVDENGSWHSWQPHDGEESQQSRSYTGSSMASVETGESGRFRAGATLAAAWPAWKLGKAEDS
eukprot:TRINITY_DN2222_c0_g2_i5.p1 TRINITY_DN2222_c0_g2~~TRINITY_DN2222_c0_g2_i5.p1  ORF type:complete len:279 (-),score=53.27 TRINITY_DN2222_c0_g2_i5:307-1143(-)